MISDQNVNDFLEHFGVAGMKWGQRKSGSTTRQKRARANKARTVSTGAKVALAGGVVGLGATLAIGKAFTGSWLNSNGHVAVSQINKSLERHSIDDLLR